MFNYNDFIFGKLILESVLVYSDDFREILKSIDSPISMYLSNIESIDLDLKNNFIDIGETNKLISYIQDGRVGDVENPFEEKRQSIKVGRGIKSILNSAGFNRSDAEIEDFVNKYKAAFDDLKKDKLSNFELVKGEDIRKWYLEDNYDDITKGTLSNSCMRYDRCQTYFDIYVDNPNVCSLLILKNDKGDKIKARSLVWELSDGRTLIDRVYYNDQSDIELYKKYSEKNGFWIKVNWEMINYQTNETKALINKNICIDLDYSDFSEYPYLDTFKYLIDGNLYTKEKSGAEAKLLEDTYGGCLVECQKCIGSGEVECSYCISGVETCYSCDGDGEVECGECYGDGEVECSLCDSGHEVCYECDGNGIEECRECSGSGEGYDGEECEKCDGDGEVDCFQCEGCGQLECVECDGSGLIGCETCDGDGEVECGECYGDGDFECGECDGVGEVECDECNDGYVDV